MIDTVTIPLEKYKSMEYRLKWLEEDLETVLKKNINLNELLDDKEKNLRKAVAKEEVKEFKQSYDGLVTHYINQSNKNTKEIKRLIEEFHNINCWGHPIKKTEIIENLTRLKEQMSYRTFYEFAEKAYIRI